MARDCVYKARERADGVQEDDSHKGQVEGKEDKEAIKDSGEEEEEEEGGG
jgi:hypothetical protein